MLSFLRNWQIVQSGCTISAFPSTMNVSSCSISSPAFDGVSVWDFRQPNRCAVLSHCFNLQFSNDVWLEHLSICLLVTCISSLVISFDKCIELWNKNNEDAQQCHHPHIFLQTGPLLAISYYSWLWQPLILTENDSQQ